MENQTQTIKILDIKAIISQIKIQETATTQKMSSKVSVPFNRSKDYHSGEKRADSDLPFNSLSISCCIKIPQIIKKLPNPSIRGKYFLSDIETIGRHKQKPIFREDSFRKMQIPYINDFLSLKPKN